jgi:large subunit ribosomal protein L4
MAVAAFTSTGNKSTTTPKLDKTVFNVELKNHNLLKAAYVAYLANGRTNNAKTKTRADVSGGGKKPWRQKGTGRARFGSTRNPIWRGGGVAFGPTGIENYTHKVHRNAKQQAIRQSLSLANTNKKLIIIDDFKTSHQKTQEAKKLLTKIGAVKNILLVVASKTEDQERSVSNLTNVKLVQANYLNVYDTMNADHIVMTTEALSMVNAWLGVKQ